jgi:hypothetical protein
MWLAGAGIRVGMVHVHDLHATLLHLMGLNHERRPIAMPAAITA